MSAEAIKFVWQYAECHGTELNVLLAIATACQFRRGPFRASISQGDLEQMCKVKKQTIVDAVRRLMKTEQLGIWEKGHGGTPTRWDILPKVAQTLASVEARSGVPFLARSDLPPQQVQAIEDIDFAPRVCETTAEGDPSAAPSQPPNIIQYPKPTKTRRRKA